MPRSKKLQNMHVGYFYIHHFGSVKAEKSQRRETKDLKLQNLLISTFQVRCGFVRVHKHYWREIANSMRASGKRPDTHTDRIYTETDWEARLALCGKHSHRVICKSAKKKIALPPWYGPPPLLRFLQPQPSQLIQD